MREDTEIANSIQGIDIIINWHSHILMNKADKINNSIVHMSGCFGENLGRLEFEYDGKIKSFDGVNIDVKDLTPNINIIKSIEINKQKAIMKLSEPLFKINENLWHDIVEENPITNFLTDSLKEGLNCEIGIINSGILNGGLKKGIVTKKKLLEIYPSPLNPTVIQVLGRNIRAALKASLDSDICMQDGSGPGFRWKYLGKLHISGGYIEYSGRDIIKITIGNKLLDDDCLYSVATSDYLQRGTGYPSLSNNKLGKYNVEYIRDTLEKYLVREDLVENSYYERWIRI